MRGETDADKVLQLLRALGQRARGPGKVYLTGGATAVLFGWRQTTVDVDLKLDPEPPGAFEAIADLKDELDLNVELASPDDFIPAVPGWRERSLPIATHGEVAFFHYDLASQALSKIERGHGRDLSDVLAMVARDLVDPALLLDRFEQIRLQLLRYPAIDEASFEAKVREFVKTCPAR